MHYFSKKVTKQYNYLISIVILNTVLDSYKNKKRKPTNPSLQDIFQ